MHVQKMHLDQNGNLTGEGIQEGKKWNMTGRIEQNGEVNLSKRYVGAWGIEVPHPGQMNAQGEIKGTWKIPSGPMYGTAGSFELYCKKKRWSGYSMQNGQSLDMNFTLEIHGQQVDGFGVDVGGSFYITGNYDAGQGKLSFWKNYHGQYSVEYNGKHTKSGPTEEVIEGQWSIPGTGQWDSFRLEYRA